MIYSLFPISSPSFKVVAQTKFSRYRLTRRKSDVPMNQLTDKPKAIWPSNFEEVEGIKKTTGKNACVTIKSVGRILSNNGRRLGESAAFS